MPAMPLPMQTNFSIDASPKISGVFPAKRCGKMPKPKKASHPNAWHSDGRLCPESQPPLAWLCSMM
jgi:hypothetical protein